MNSQKTNHSTNGIAGYPFKILVIVLSIIVLQSVQLNGDEDLQRRSSFDFDWKFCLGDIPGAEASEYDDANWRSLNLPHDWSIEGEYKESNPTGWRGGFLPTGIGWYRKSFTLDPSIEGNRVFLEFDGIYLNSDVYINGHHLGHRPNGYISFQYDITDFLNFNGPNLVAIRVDHSVLIAS